MSDDPLIRYLRQPSARTFAALVRETRADVLGAAYRVLGDRARAEDVTQEVFVKLLVLDLKPDEVRSGAGLLAQSAVNLAKTVLRGEARRANREREAAARREASEEPISPADAEVVRDAVGALPESLRAAVELRYFGGLKLADVANQLGWPLRTVKHRLKQARDRLEGQLASVHGGVVLLSLTEEGAPSLPTMPASTALDERLERIASEGFESARVARWPRIRWPRFVPIAALVGAAIVVTAVMGPQLLAPGASSPPEVPPAQESAEAVSTGAPRNERVPRDGARGEPRTAPEPEDVEPTDAPVVRDADAREPTCDVEIRVIGPDGTPIPDAHVLVELNSNTLAIASRDGKLHRFEALRGKHAAPRDGVIRVPGVPVTRHDARFTATAWAAGAGSVVAHSEQLVNGTTCVLEVRLVVAGELAVTVRDARSGKPIRGALVHSMTESGRRRLDAETIAERDDPWRAVTDERGGATLGDLGEGLHVLAVSAEGYAHTMLDRVRPGDTRAIRLEPVSGEGTVVIRVFDPGGDPVANAAVELSAGAHGESRKQTTDEAGEARFDGVAAGVSHTATLDMTAWIMRSVQEKWDDSNDGLQFIAHTRVAEGETSVVQLGVVKGEGRVVIRALDETGRPLAGVPVQLVRMDPILILNAETDADGRAVFDDVSAGSFTWSVGANPEWDGANPVEASPGSPVEIDVRVGTATIAGRVLDPVGKPVASARVHLHGADVGQFVKADSEGRFELQRVPVGRFVAHAYRAGHASAFAEVEIVRGAPQDELELRLTTGEPVEVTFGGRHATEVTRFAVTAHGPHDIEISLGGELIEAGVRARLQLAPGRYRIHAAHEDGTVLEQQMTVVRGSPVRVHFGDE